MTNWTIIFTGLDLHYVAITTVRVALGLFFLISGYHKLFNPVRHASIVQTMTNDHVPFIKFNCWFVPSIEFLGGFALMIGLLAPLAALGLFVICCMATFVDGIKRIPTWHPLDKADYVDDVLYLPEVLYSVMLWVVILGGSGPYSLDHYIMRWL